MGTELSTICRLTLLACAILLRGIACNLVMEFAKTALMLMTPTFLIEENYVFQYDIREHPAGRMAGWAPG
jgi:hypothetical protein